MSERDTAARGIPFAGDSLVHMLEHRAATQPDETAYTFLRDGELPSAAISWSNLAQASRTVAGWLQTHLAPGDRALLLYPPGLDFIAAFFGCLYAGVLAVPVLPPQGGRSRRGVDRLASIAADAEPRCTLTNTELELQLARESREGLLGTIEIGIPWVATDRLPGDLASAQRIRRASRDTLAFLQYTSGSTARPKGVMVTHGNLLHNLDAAFHLGEHGAHGVSVSWLPVTHDMGLIEGVLQPAFSGCPAYLMSPGAFLQRPVRWLKAISTFHATRSGGPNFAYDLAVTRVSREDREMLDLGCWRAAYNGAEPIRHDTMSAFARAYGGSGFDPAAFRPCYGLAESTLLVSTGRWVERDGDVSCGTPAFGTQVRIVDPATHTACRDGEVGEIQVAGESVTLGYWNRPHETAAAYGGGVGGSSDRWLRTGDLGYLRAGELYVTGRIKDLLIVRGAKHFPQDLEHTAERHHPAIRAGSVAAVAVSNGVRGDRVALVAEVDPRLLDPGGGDGLITGLRQAIADLHGIQLHGVALVSPGSMPKTTSGKLQRFLCRDGWVSGTLTPLAMWSQDVLGADLDRPAREAHHLLPPS
ncbi:MAG TPA: fatty acyl-AMP ligase [Vicinamibacterales bacterium]|nr:fatty acyl-AMP ligase [Vicinamibacterales bacterium]